MEVVDRTGVLSAISALFAKHNVSLRTVRQEDGDGIARLIVVTHTALEHEMQGIVEELGQLDDVKAVHSVIRLDGGQL